MLWRVNQQEGCDFEDLPKFCWGEIVSYPAGNSKRNGITWEYYISVKLGKVRFFFAALRYRGKTHLRFSKYGPKEKKAWEDFQQRKG